MLRFTIMRRLVIAVVVGLLGSLFIWAVTPYNNFVLGNSYISDDYMPVAALFVIMVITLVINPLLLRFAPRFSLKATQLAVIFGILLMACVTPSQGLLREMPYMLAGANHRASESMDRAETYDLVDPPASLFPEPLGYEQPVPAVDSFLLSLSEGESIPWGKWLPPTLSWGAFLVPWWLMMIAIALIVLPQWRDNERQPFPLLRIQQLIVQSPEEGKLLPPVFHSKLFLGGLLSVFFLHFLAGMHAYFPGDVPQIPLTWNLWRCFTEAPLRHLPWYIKANRIHFIFLGIAFFMPKRIGFSIWFFQIAYAVFVMYKAAYDPPFDWQIVTDHRIGAFFAVPIGVLWLGRRHWAKVFRSLVRPAESEEDRTNRVAVILLLSSMLGMLAWMLWVKVHPAWALGLLVIAFLYALAITRIVTETGLPLIAPDTRYVMTLAKMMPQAWRTAPSMYFAGVLGFFFGHGNRLCVTTMVIHALGLDESSSARRRLRLGMLFLAVLVLSMVVCGAVHLHASYNNAMTLNGRESPISSWGVGTMSWTGERLVSDFKHGRVSDPGYNQAGNIAFGAAFAFILQFLCQFSPRWPLHPVALLFVTNWYAHRVWVSVFIGWLAKVLILRFGGSRVHNLAGKLFIGFVMGEVLAVAFWSLVTGILGALGLEYQVVSILPF